MKIYQDSLSVVLPIRDEATTLAQRISNLLEILPDLTSQFEILIVDHCSQDQSEEVAHELALEYPQVRALRQSVSSQRTAEEELLRIAIDESRGSTMIVFDERVPVRANRMSEMWGRRRVGQRNILRMEALPEPSLIERLKGWGSGLSPDVTRGPAATKRQDICTSPQRPPAPRPLGYARTSEELKAW